MVRPPLPGPAAVARRRDVPAPKQIDFGLALGNDDRAAMGESLEQLGQPIRHRIDAVEVPDPAAVSIRAPLANLLAAARQILALDLVQQSPAGAAIVEVALG
jgi:hypothetical protein